MSDPTNDQVEERVFENGEIKGYDDHKQEVLGYLRLKFDEHIETRDFFMKNLLALSAYEYHEKAKIIKSIVKDLYGESETAKMKVIY